MAWVDCCGGFVMTSAYLRTGEGLSVGNLAIIRHLCAALAGQDHSCACARDFNMEPEELMQAQELEELGAVVVAPREAAHEQGGNGGSSPTSWSARLWWGESRSVRWTIEA